MCYIRRTQRVRGVSDSGHFDQSRGRLEALLLPGRPGVPSMVGIDVQDVVEILHTRSFSGSGCAAAKRCPGDSKSMPTAPQIHVKWTSPCPRTTILHKNVALKPHPWQSQNTYEAQATSGQSQKPRHLRIHLTAILRTEVDPFANAHLGPQKVCLCTIGTMRRHDLGVIDGTPGLPGKSKAFKRPRRRTKCCEI